MVIRAIQNRLYYVNETSSWQIDGLQPATLVADMRTVLLFRKLACGVDSEQGHAAMNSQNEKL